MVLVKEYFVLTGVNHNMDALYQRRVRETTGAFFLRKSKIGFLNPKESENRFCVSLLNRSIQDLLDHAASKEPKNPLPEWILWFL